MTNPPDDKWVAGDAYEAYMGRWSRPLARVFLEWLQPPPSAHWLEVGCGTGALTSAICDRCEPASVVASDPSDPFIGHARANLPDARASFVVAGADALPRRSGGFDVAVSGLVLNFLPNPAAALTSIRERLRPGAEVAACVWDYAEGMQWLRHFWDEAVALDCRAAALDEGRRFPICQRSALASLFEGAGLAHVGTHPLEIATDFSDFDDYWTPFLKGTGPGPSYVASLDPPSRDALRDRLRQRVQTGDERIQLRARAWAVRGVAP